MADCPKAIGRPRWCACHGWEHEMTEQHEREVETEPEFHDISGIKHLADFWDEPYWVLRDMHPNLIKARSEILDKIIEDAQNLDAYRESLILDNRELQAEIETLKPTWVCEFCFACLLDGDLPSDWDLVWQSAICPSCQKKVKRNGGYGIVKGGAYSDGRRDPRTITPNLPQERK